MTLADIRAEARRIEHATNYEHASRTPTKRLAALIVALTEHLERQPVQTLATVNATLETINDRDTIAPHWSASVERQSA